MFSYILMWLLNQIIRAYEVYNMCAYSHWGDFFEFPPSVYEWMFSSGLTNKLYSQALNFCQLYSFSSVQFSHSVALDSLWPHGLQHTRPPCPAPIPRVYSDSCTLSQWCHPTISSSVVPFSSCPQSLPASGSFPMSQLFSSGGQSIGVSVSASVLPMNTQD